MNSIIFESLKPIKYVLIISVIEFIILFSFFTALYSRYDKNLFEIELNGKLMNCYYAEKYSNGLSCSNISLAIKSPNACNSLEFDISILIST